MRKVYIGIDIGSKTSAAAAIDVRGRLLAAEEFKTTERNLIGFVQRQGKRARVLIEEGELAGWVYRTLLPDAEIVEVADPKRNAWIAKAARKDDRTDALKLAELLRLGSYSPIYHPEEEEMAAFKVTVKHYDRMVKRTTAVMNQIKAILRGQGVITDGKQVYGIKGRAEAISEVTRPEVREMLMQDYSLLDHLLKERARARSLVVRLSKKFPVIERFRKMPGVDYVLASRFVAYIQNPNRFNKRELWRFSSLGVVKRESAGSSVGREHLDKAGNGALKDLSRKAFNGAMTTRRDNGIKTFYQRSCARTGNKNHARLNTQRKILVVMNAVWRDGTEYSDEMFIGKGAFGST